MENATLDKRKDGTARMTDADMADLCRRIRIDIINMIASAGSGHPGGSLSSVELLTAVFFDQLERTPENVASPNRDRLVISKGHGVPTLYALLAEVGIIEHEALKTFRELGSKLQGHPDRIRLPAVESATGSLGQGLSVAQGMAMAAKLKGSGARVFCLVGDGEIQEGQVWETMMSAPKFGLDNLVAILDANGGQLDGHTPAIMDIEDVAAKARAFNWHTVEIDGHDLGLIRRTLDEVKSVERRPVFLVARTLKGKGVSFMEGNIGFHGKAPDAEQTAAALRELGA